MPKSSNLAAEFYVASLLFRLGYNTTLTLGNTKEIDLIVYNEKTKETITVDVKGLKGTTSWFMPDNEKLLERETHFFVLVTFKNKITQSDIVPEVYVIPSKKVRGLLETWHSKKDKKSVNGITYKNIKNHPELNGAQGFKQLFGQG